MFLFSWHFPFFLRLTMDISPLQPRTRLRGEFLLIAEPECAVRQLILQVTGSNWQEWMNGRGDAGGGNWIVMQMYRKVYENPILKDVSTSLVMEYMKVMNLGGKVDFINSWSDLKDGENTECKKFAS